MVRNLKEALREGQWESGRLMVRFISDMVNCHIVSASSLLQLYDSFIDAAMEQGVPQVRRDWYDDIFQQKFLHRTISIFIGLQILGTCMRC